MCILLLSVFINARDATVAGDLLFGGLGVAAAFAMIAVTNFVCGPGVVFLSCCCRYSLLTEFSDLQIIKAYKSLRLLQLIAQR